MIRKILAILWLIILIVTPSANAHELEGSYLYKVTTIRAERGNFSDLLDWISELRASNYFTDAGKQAPFIMRHSQGDQWDLLVITPMGSWADYYSKAATKKRAKAAQTYAGQLKEGYGFVAFEEDIFAYGPPLDDVKEAFESNSFYHIEMFEAGAGKTDELFEQRRMENKYLKLTGQKENMIFSRAGGSDVDIFTIGFHSDFETFVTQGTATPEEKEAAAKASGFKDRADLSFYLRSLITGHNDTFAGKVD